MGLKSLFRAFSRSAWRRPSRLGVGDLNPWERWCERRIEAYRRRHDRVLFGPRWFYGSTPVVSFRYWLADFVCYRGAALALWLARVIEGGGQP